MKLLIRIYFRT